MMFSGVAASLASWSEAEGAQGCCEGPRDTGCERVQGGSGGAGWVLPHRDPLRCGGLVLLGRGHGVRLTGPVGRGLG